jgi:hypothetical protein
MAPNECYSQQSIYSQSFYITEHVKSNQSPKLYHIKLEWIKLYLNQVPTLDGGCAHVCSFIIESNAVASNSFAYYAMCVWMYIFSPLAFVYSQFTTKSKHQFSRWYACIF